MSRRATPGPPPADAETIGRIRLAVLRLSRRLRQNAAAGVTPSQLSVLSTLGRHGPMTLGDLAAHEGVQPPTVTRMVTTLEEAGLVSRAGSTSDRRAVVATLTAEGARAVDEIRRRRDAWLAERLALLTRAELAVLESALPVIERLAGEHPPAEGDAGGAPPGAGTGAER